jgi:hypothetical protein
MNEIPLGISMDSGIGEKHRVRTPITGSICHIVDDDGGAFWKGYGANNNNMEANCRSMSSSSSL